MYKVEISKKALKELVENPYSVIGTKKLVNPKSLGIDLDEVYRVRVGDYRAIYSIENNILTIYVLKVAHRKEVYE